MNSKPKEFSLKDKLTFGQYKGDTIQEIIDNDPSYLKWAIGKIEWFELDGEASKELLKYFYQDDEDYSWDSWEMYQDDEDYSWEDGFHGFT